MSNLYLKLTGLAGSDIAICSAEAIRISEHLGLTVSFNFNGVECFARLGGNASDMVRAYHSGLAARSSLVPEAKKPAPISGMIDGWSEQPEDFASAERDKALSFVQINGIMAQAQIFASAWSLVGGRFDSGSGMELVSLERTALRNMLLQASFNGTSAHAALDAAKLQQVLEAILRIKRHMPDVYDGLKFIEDAESNLEDLLAKAMSC